MAGEQQLGALARLENLEKELKSLKESLVTGLQGAQHTAERLLSTEQSMSALARTFAAVVKSLESKGYIKDSDVMDLMHQQDDKEARESVDEMLAGGYIVASEKADENSLVVVEHDILDMSTSTTKRVSAYRKVELPSPVTPLKLKNDLLGRKVGDKFEAPTKEGSSEIAIITVIGVYNLAEINKEGEGPKAEAQAGAEATAEQPTAQS